MILKQDFFGREAVMDVLKKRVLDLKEGYRQNVALLGNRYVGKTAILQHFLANFDEEGITVISLDLENKDFHFFLKKFTGSLLYNYARSRGLSCHDDVDLLLETLKEEIPQTVQVIKKIYKDYHAKKLSTCFLGVLALPEIFTNETGRCCLLVLDEFQEIETFGIAHAFAHLGKKIMTQKKCLYVVTSSFPQTAKRILSEKLSLLFGNFEILSVEPFSPKTSQEFIRTKLGDIKIGDSLRNFLIDFTGGYPLYLNLICDELVGLSARYHQSEIFIPVLTQAVEHTLFNRWGVIGRHFELILQELLSGKGNRVVPWILIAIANDKHKLDELSAYLKLNKSFASARINRLMEAGIIFKNGNFHYFRDKLFKYWVKYILQQRLKTVTADPEHQRHRFQEEFCVCIENFKITSRKDLPARIVELLYCFDNESFDLNGRKYKLPLFREIVPLRLRSAEGNDFDVIRASTAEHTWFVAVKDECLGEAEVTTLLDETRRCGKRPERCLIVSLNDLDEHTRLRALQERFWIWSEEEVNALLTFFDKPFIVR